MKNFLLIIFTAFLLCGCNKEENEPNSDFSFRGENVSTFTMATKDTCTLINNSINAVSYLWDFDNGRQSKEKHPIITYQTSGTYEITLTTVGSDGEISVLTKEIKILDRVLKKIIIENVIWEKAYSKDIIANIYFQIQDYTDLHQSPVGIFPNCKILYKSNTIDNIPYNNQVPIEILLENKLVIEKDKLDFFVGEYNLDRCYVFNLIGLDSKGENFIINNNHGGGGNTFSIMKEDLDSNEFIFGFGTSAFSKVKLICEFE